jgi:hypothetical protein
MALSRSPTVSLPVEVYVVVLVPSLTVIVPFAMMPSVNSEVLAVSGTVPVPIAGAARVGAALDVPDEFELGEEEEDDADEVLDDEVVSPVLLEPPLMDASALCTAAVSWVFTRFRAVWLARLAKPLDSVLDAPNIALMVESACAVDDASLDAWLQ